MKTTFVALFLAAILLIFVFALKSETAIHAQGPGRIPTEEPTKPPYVFPTPIFIPTFPPDNSAATPSRAPIPPGGQSYTVQAGDTLSLIARKMYGDPNKSRLIADANNLTDATRLRVGMVLIIPPLRTDQPTASPTLTPPTSVSTIAAATAIPKSTTSQIPTSTPSETETPVSPELVFDIINFVACILFIGCLVFAVLAFLLYRRSRA